MFEKLANFKLKRSLLAASETESWAKESSLELSQFSLRICQPNHTILAFLRRCQPCLNHSGYGSFCNYQGLSK